MFDKKNLDFVWIDSPFFSPPYSLDIIIMLFSLWLVKYTIIYNKIGRNQSVSSPFLDKVLRNDGLAGAQGRDKFGAYGWAVLVISSTIIPFEVCLIHLWYSTEKIPVSDYTKKIKEYMCLHHVSSRSFWSVYKL